MQLIYFYFTPNLSSRELGFLTQTFAYPAKYSTEFLVATFPFTSALQYMLSLAIFECCEQRDARNVVTKALFIAQHVLTALLKVRKVMILKFSAS